MRRGKYRRRRAVRVGRLVELALLLGGTVVLREWWMWLNDYRPEAGIHFDRVVEIAMRRGSKQ